MNEITTIGLDLAKSVFHVIGLNTHGKIALKRSLRRAQLLGFFARQPNCLVAMEACSGAHDWARKLQHQGHQVKLIPAQRVKAFVQGNKTDFNDALGIAEAALRPEIRTVRVKTEAEQDLQLLNQSRQGLIKRRTMVINQVRALLLERGIPIPRGRASVRRAVAEYATGESLSPIVRHLVSQVGDQLRDLDQQIQSLEDLLAQVNAPDPGYQALQQIPGFGPILSSFFRAHVGDGKSFHGGRAVSASIGVVPGQHSSGGRTVLLGISKRGQKTLRCLTVHGSRSVVSRAGGKTDPLSVWIQQLVARVGIHKATVAYANKMARMGWAVLRYGGPYDVHRAVGRRMSCGSASAE
jgi:transposase